MKYNGCPNCKDPLSIIWYNWKLYNENYIITLKKIQNLKFGELFICLSCKGYWYVDQHSNVMDFIKEDVLSSVMEWSHRNLSIDKKYLPILKSIGATPPDHYGNLSEYISIPCKCNLKTGQILDFCIISIQKIPPVGPLYFFPKSKYIFIDEVVDIRRSDFTLSNEVRLKTTEAFEYRMGYAPTVVKGPNNKIYVLNGVENFFKDDSVKGNEIKLGDQEEISKGELIQCQYQVIRVIADWEEQFLALRLTKKACS